MTRAARRYSTITLTTTLALCLALGSGCAAPRDESAETGAPEPAAQPNESMPDESAGSEPMGSEQGATDGPLADTEWRLVHFQSMDDSIGTMTPSDPSLYTLRLAADGSLSMKLDCNQGTGTWSAVATADDGTSGTFEMGPLAMTRALCPPPSMGEKIAKDAEWLRSYLIRDGQLSLSLMADGGIYVWEPI